MVFGMGGGGGNEIEVVVSSDTSDFQGGIDEAIQSVQAFKSAAVGMGAAITAGSVAAMGKAVSAAREMASVNRELQRTMPADEAAAVTSAIDDMGSTIPMTTGELGNIAAQASQFGVDGVDNIDKFTRAVAKMAAGTDLSSARAGRAFANLANQMDIPTSEAENLGSTMNALSNNMAASSSEIVRATTKSAASLTQLGMSKTEIIALNSALIDAGMEASNAGRGMRRLQQSMQDPTKAADMAGALGMNVDQFKAMRDEDPTKLIMHMAKVLNEGGTQAETLGGVLTSFSQKTLTMLGSNLENANMALDQSAKAYKENTSLQEEFETQTDSLGARIQILRNEIGSMLAKIGQHYTPILKGATNVTIGAIRALKDLSDATNGAAGAVALAAGAIGGMVPVVMALSSVIGPLTPLIIGVGAAMASIMAIVVALGAAIATLAAGWQANFGGIQTSTNIVMGEVRRQFSETMPLLRELVGTVLSDIQAMWAGHGTRIENIVGEHIGRVTTFLVEGMMTLGDRVRQVLQGMLTWWQQHRQQVAAVIQALGPILLGFANGVIQKFKLAIEGAVMLGTRLWQLFGDQIQAGVSRITQSLAVVIQWWNNLDSTHRTIAKGIAVVIAALLRIMNPISFVITAIATLAAAWKTNFMGIRDATAQATSIVTQQITTMRNRVQQLLTRVIELWTQHGQQVIQRVRTSLQQLLPVVQSSLTTMIQVTRTVLAALVQVFRDNLAMIKTTVQLGLAAVLATVNAVLPAILNIARSILSSLTLLWQNNINQIKTIVRSGLTILVQITNTILQIVLMTWAANIDAIMQTVERGAQNIIQIVTMLLNRILQITAPILARLAVFWQQHGDDIALIVSTLATLVIRTITTLMNALMSLIEPALAALQVAWEMWGDEIVTVVELVADVVLSVVGALIDTLATIIRIGLAAMESDWDTVWNEIAGLTERIAGGILNFITNWGGRLIDYIAGMLSDLFQAFLDWGNDLIFGSLIKDMFNAIYDFITETLGDLLSSVTDYLGDIKDTITDSLTAAKENAVDAMNDMKDSVIGVLEDIVGAFEDKLSRVRDLAGDIVGAAEGAARDAKNALNDARDYASSAKDKVTSVDVPGFQHGGIVSSPTTARIGEQGPEAVIPMNRLDRLVTKSMGDAMRQTGGGGGGGGGGKTVVVENLYTQAGTRAQARQVKDELADALDAENIR